MSKFDQGKINVQEILTKMLTTAKSFYIASSFSSDLEHSRYQAFPRSNQKWTMLLLKAQWKKHTAIQLEKNCLLSIKFPKRLLLFVIFALSYCLIISVQPITAAMIDKQIASPIFPVIKSQVASILERFVSYFPFPQHFAQPVRRDFGQTKSFRSN